MTSGAARPRIVVVEHSDTAPLGPLGGGLASSAELLLLRGWSDPDDTRRAVEALSADGRYDAVVALGGPMGAYEIDEHPSLGATLRLLADALVRGLPILGICLGSQLLAQALGSPAYPGRDVGLPRELGFLPLRPTAEGASDPVVSLFVGERVLFWHQDTHDLPAGATLLAATDLYPVGAFRWGRWAYGLQFHPETDQPVLGRRVALFPEKVADAGLDPQQLLAEGRAYADLIERRADALGRLFAGWAAEARAEGSVGG